MANLIANELLCFLSSQYDKVDKDSLFSTASGFYSFEESIAAKQLLIDECDKLGLTDSILEFKNELRSEREKKGSETNRP